MSPVSEENLLKLNLSRLGVARFVSKTLPRTRSLGVYVHTSIGKVSPTQGAIGVQL